jgi:GT2 family glycosyltransferase
VSDPGSDYPVTFPAEVAQRPVCDELTVIIPTLGRPILETCLYYLATGSMWPAAVIIVDQGDHAGTARLLARVQQSGLPTVHIPSTQRGRSAGINRGLERVATAAVAITDDDCFVAADWLEKMWIGLQREPDVIRTGRVELAGDPEAEFSTVTSREPRVFRRPQLKAHPFIGGNVGMAMKIVEWIGAFDEHPCLASAEDSDYGYRALRSGIPIAYDPDVVVYHYHWRGPGDRAARYRDYARSQGGFYGTHLRGGDTLIALQAMRALLRSPVRWLRGVAFRDPELRANGRAHTLHLLPGMIAGWKRGTQRI